MTTTQRQQPNLMSMYVGLVLTVSATIAPFVDRATSNVLADHIRNGYPAFPRARVDSAVTAWLVILSVVGIVGVVSWLWTIRAVRTRKWWARWAASAMFALGSSVALTGLLVKDTSGDTGLAPLLGCIGILPCWRARLPSRCCGGGRGQGVASGRRPRRSKPVFAEDTLPGAFR